MPTGVCSLAVIIIFILHLWTIRLSITFPRTWDASSVATPEGMKQQEDLMEWSGALVEWDSSRDVFLVIKLKEMTSDLIQGKEHNILTGH